MKTKLKALAGEAIATGTLLTIIVATIAAMVMIRPAKAADPNSNVYTFNQAGKGATVASAVVVGIQNVQLKPDTTYVGTGAGAIVGGIIGNNLGRGRSGEANLLSMGLGALLGGAVGGASERAVRSRPGYAIAVRFDENNSDMIITQSAETSFSIGQRVTVTHDYATNSFRVLPFALPRK